jgi:hypothetical protein
MTEQQTPASVVDLCERLRRLTPSGSNSVITSRVLVNPDGPEAAAMIERLLAEREGLVKALTVARHALVCTENLRCTDQSIEALAAKLVNGIPREQLEFMTDFTAELALIDAALTQGESRQTLPAAPTPADGGGE